MEKDSELSSSTPRGRTGDLLAEQSGLEEQLFQVMRQIKHINEKTQEADFEKFMKLYNETAGRIVRECLEPLKHSLKSVLPEATEPGFYSFSASHYPVLKAVRFSASCSMLTETLPIDKFIVINSFAACALLLMRLLEINVEKKFYTCSGIIFNLLRKLTMKYHLKYCYGSLGSLVFDFLVMFYSLPTWFRNFIGNDDCVFPSSEESRRIPIYLSVDLTLVGNFCVNPAIYDHPYYTSLVMENHDDRRRWLALCMRNLESKDVFLSFCGDIATGRIFTTLETKINSFNALITRVVQFLLIGDNLIASMLCWFVAKLFFRLSYLAKASVADALKYTAKHMIVCAEQLEEASFTLGERFEPYHKILRRLGLEMSNILRLFENEEDFAASVLQLLETKSCDDHLAQKLTIPLVLKVASYRRSSRLARGARRPARHEYLDILLYIRLLNPRSTVLALEAVLAQYRNLMSQFKFGEVTPKRPVLKHAFKYLTLAYPILSNELFIRNKLKSLHLDGSSVKVKKVLDSFQPLLKRLEHLRSRWRRGQFPAKLKDGGVHTPKNTKAKYPNSIDNATMCCEQPLDAASNIHGFIEQRAEIKQTENEGIKEHGKAIQNHVVLSCIIHPLEPSNRVASNHACGEKINAKPCTCRESDDLSNVTEISGGVDESSHGNVGEGHNETKREVKNEDTTKIADAVKGKLTDEIKGKVADAVVRKVADFVKGKIADVVKEKVADTAIHTRIIISDIPKGNPATIKAENHLVNVELPKELGSRNKPNNCGPVDEEAGNRADEATINVNRVDSCPGTGDYSTVLPRNDEISIKRPSLGDRLNSLPPFDPNEHRSKEIWSLLLDSCQKCADVETYAEHVLGLLKDQTYKSEHLRDRVQIRSTEEVIKMCHQFNYNFKESLPNEKSLHYAVQESFKKCLYSLLEDVENPNDGRSTNPVIPALDDENKLRDMLKKILQPTKDQLEHLVNWLQNIENYLC